MSAKFRYTSSTRRMSLVYPSRKRLGLHRFFCVQVWLLLLLLFTLRAAPARAQHTQPIVAIHDSELTRALETMPASGATPTGPGTTGFQWWPAAWHYFVMPDAVKQALRSDGTPFVVLSDAKITSGALLATNGVPNYPIFISLSAEAIRDNEVGPLTNYVAAGGTLLVGGSSFTRTTNGVTRGDFAIANAMGVHMVNPSLENWTADTTFSKLVADLLTAHIPGGVLDWNLPVSADEISWGVSPLYLLSQGHLCWQVSATNALVLAQGDTGPYLVRKPFGKGTIIYEAAMQPLIGHGGNAPGMYAYGIFRNAIQQSFAAANLAIPKLSPWPFAYDAALEVRHDLENLQDQISAIPASAQFESTNGAKGDYYFCTGTLRVEMTTSASAIAGLCKAVTNYGATIGPHNGGLPNSNNPALVLSNYDYWHWGTDEALDLTNLGSHYSNGATYGFISTSNSFRDVEGWLGRLTNGLRLMVAPHFNATREASYQIQQELKVKGTGEQKIGPFPGWVLSTSLQTADKIYPFVSLPTSDWYLVAPTVAQSMENGFVPGTMRQLIDFYYGWGALINVYSHSSSAGNGIAGTLASSYVTYGMSKPRIWPANLAGIYSWWLSRSNAQITPVFTTNGNRSVATFTVHGAKDSRTAIELLVPRPSVSSLQVLTNGVAAGTNIYRTNGSVIKVLVGTAVTNAQVSYLLNPQIQSNFFIVAQGTVLSVPAPGVLTNALPGAGTQLMAMLVSGPAHGTFSLSNNGAFSYTPSTNFTGIDSFSFRASDGVATSAVATVTLDVAPAGSLFFDNFVRSTNADPLAPWIPTLGAWTIGGGLLQGTDPDSGTENNVYVAENWTNYTIQAQVQISPGGFGGGLSGRINPLTGAKYGVDIYPNGVPGQTTHPVLSLLKYHTWQVLGPAPMQQVTLPTVGTNWHSLQVAFRGSEILAYFDGALMMDVTDTGFDGLPAYATGGFGAHFYNYDLPLTVGFQDLQVTPVATGPVANNDSYSTVQNRTFTIPPPGVLANDLPGTGTNLFAVLLQGPTNGTLTLSSNGGFTYRPDTNFLGTDSFTYEANDGFTNSAAALVTITVTTNSPPVANDDTYVYLTNTTLTVSAPGVLANDVDPDGDALTAVLVSGPAYGTLNLSSNGGFTYLPATNFGGTDSFTYKASDGMLTSSVATVTLVNPAFGAFFYDNFIRQTNPGPLTPWVAQSGAWTVTGGVLEGGPDVADSYANVYLTNSWTDYSVAANLQFSTNAYGGGVGGRLNPATGAHYAAWIYPPANNLALIKFQNWTSPSFLATANLPVIGTNWHTVKLAFRGTHIAVYCDGSQVTNVADASSPFLSGGVSLDMYTTSTPFVFSVNQVVVDPLVMGDAYFVTENTTLTVPPPGVLGNDTGVFSTNLSVILPVLSGPGHGVLTVNTNGGFAYTPSTNYTGPDNFSYQAGDSQTNLGTAAVALMVVPPNKGKAGAPVIQSFTWSNGIGSLTWSSVAGNTYRVQFNDDLTTTNWNAVSPDVLATDSTTAVTNLPASSTHRFYRVLLLP